MERKRQKMVITLENVEPAQAIALKKMFEHMEYLGAIGSRRKCSFVADGDGSFHPKVSIDYPQELPELKEITGLREDDSFDIDPDSIAWKIYFKKK